jgi:hypothetical protein
MSRVPNDKCSPRQRRNPGEARKFGPRELSSLAVGQSIADPASADATALEARRVKSGVAFYFRYQNSEGKRDRLPLGRFDPEGVTGLTVAQARDEAARLTARIRAEGRDLRAMLEADALRARRELDAEAARQAAESRARERSASRTVGAVLDAYCDALDKAGRSSAPKVRAALRLHVREALPELWAADAATVTPRMLADAPARLVAAGKEREAGKVRAYLRAAFAMAAGAAADPSAPEALRQMELEANPAALVKPVRGSVKPRHRALTVPELRAYWQRVQALADPHRALLTVHLLSGGQRVEQLARLTLADWDRAAGAVTLKDGKGRRAAATLHRVPTLPPVAAALAVMRRGAAGPHLFTLDGGKHGATYGAVRDAVGRVAAAMVEAGEALEAFTPGDLRRTVETVLSASGVSREVRGWLLSHGNHGVQAVHYDRADREPAMLAALRVLWSAVDPDAEQADRAERERLASLAKGGSVLQFKRPAA